MVEQKKTMRLPLNRLAQNCSELTGLLLNGHGGTQNKLPGKSGERKHFLSLHFIFSHAVSLAATKLAERLHDATSSSTSCLPALPLPTGFFKIFSKFSLNTQLWIYYHLLSLEGFLVQQKLVLLTN